MTVRIAEDELVALALDLCNIDSPMGKEAAAGEFVLDWMNRHGIPARKVAMMPERFNVLGRVRGAGDGYSLIFNSHLDTSKDPDDTLSLRNARAPIYRSAWRDGNVLFGDGVVNDKGPMAAWMMAAKAIVQSGATLRGDLLLSAVPGEIGAEPIDEFAAPEHMSKEVGTRWLIQHGGVADCALVAEGTDFRMTWIEAGKAFFKLTVFGDEQIYTPFLPSVPASVTHPNAIIRAAVVLPAIQEWARAYEDRFTYRGPGGTIKPKVCIGAIRGGNPYHVTRTSEVCAVYLDVRLIPDQDPLALKRELVDLLAAQGVPGEVELFLYRRAYEAKNPELIVDGIRRGHRAVFGTDAEMAPAPYSSMWRDVSIFNEMGIPAVTYGPPRSIQAMSMRIEDLVKAAEVYAAIALEICNRPKPHPAA
jgi:acetylornithine deacetylase/succinyl-diaminopimelate desuccinylase-like protein